MRADGVGRDTVLSGIIRLVEEAQSSKAPIQKLADKVSAIFVPAVIGAALLTFVLTLVFMRGADGMTCLLYTSEFMVTSVRLTAAKDGVVIAASFAGKLKTVAQFVAILFMLAAMEFATWQTSVLSAFTLPDLVFTLPLLIGLSLIHI